MTCNFHRILSSAIYYHSPCRVSMRLYGRWMHRKPAKINLPFEPPAKINLKKETIINLADLQSKNEQATDKNIVNSQQTEHFENVKSRKQEKLKKRNFFLSQLKVFDENNEIIYEKLKDDDGRISSLLVKMKSKKDRSKGNQVLVEGWRLIVDGLEAKCKLKYLMFSRIEDLNHLRPFLPKTGVKIYRISYKTLQMWSDVETSPGIIGIFQTPSPENVKQISRPLPLQIICDQVRVPGNLGAILRVAVGVGCEKVLLTKGCTDLWDSKVIRSAAGAHFRLPIYHSVDWEDIPKQLEDGTSVIIADSNIKVSDDPEDKQWETLRMPVVPYYSIEYATLRNMALIIGGETEGISEDSYKLAISRNGLRINIPLSKGVDSLNTGMAAAVIAFEIRKHILTAWNREKLRQESIEAV